MKRVKCVLIGDGGDIGQRRIELLVTYIMNEFPEDYCPTVFDVPEINMLVDDQPVALNLQDTAGQEDYDRLRQLTYQNTDVFLIVYSITDVNSFLHIKSKWCLDLNVHAPGIPFLIVGTEIDKRTEADVSTNTNIIQVTKEMGELLAKEVGAYMYIETSARTRENLKELFLEAVRCALAKQTGSNSAMKERKTSLFGTMFGGKDKAKVSTTIASEETTGCVVGNNTTHTPAAEIYTALSTSDTHHSNSTYIGLSGDSSNSVSTSDVQLRAGFLDNTSSANEERTAGNTTEEHPVHSSVALVVASSTANGTASGYIAENTTQLNKEERKQQEYARLAQECETKNEEIATKKPTTAVEKQSAQCCVIM